MDGGRAGRAAGLGRRDGLRARRADAPPRCTTPSTAVRWATARSDARAGVARRWPRSPPALGSGPSTRRTWCLVPDVMRGHRARAAHAVPRTPRWSCRRRRTRRSCDVVPLTGRTLVDRCRSTRTARRSLDLDRLDAALAAGARTVLLCQPHNPWGRVFTRGELEGLRDVVVRHGARVISDEMHAPLVLPGATHVALRHPRAAPRRTPRRSCRRPRRGTCPGCAVPRWSRAPRRTPASSAPCPWSPSTAPRRWVWSAHLAAYREGTPWLEELRRRLDGNRTLFAELVAELLPQVRRRRSRRRTSPGSTSAGWGCRTRRVWRCATGGCSSTTGRTVRPGWGRARPRQPGDLARPPRPHRPAAGLSLDAPAVPMRCGPEHGPRAGHDRAVGRDEVSATPAQGRRPA